MPMKDPPHPGRSVRHDCPQPLGLKRDGGAEPFEAKMTRLTSERPGFESLRRSFIAGRLCSFRIDVYSSARTTGKLNT